MITLGIGVAVHGLVIIMEPRDIAHVLRIITRKREPSLLTSQVEKVIRNLRLSLLRRSTAMLFNLIFYD